MKDVIKQRTGKMITSIFVLFEVEDMYDLTGGSAAEAIAAAQTRDRRADMVLQEYQKLQLYSLKYLLFSDGLQFYHPMLFPSQVKNTIIIFTIPHQGDH